MTKEEPNLKSADMPECLRCNQSNRIVCLGFNTDFGGHVTIYGCRRCGVFHAISEGTRREDNLENPPSGFYKSGSFYGELQDD